MFVIDRIEEGIAVILDGENNQLKINSSEILGNVKEGAVVLCKDNKWTVDEEETQKRTEKMRARLNRLFNK